MGLCSHNYFQKQYTGKCHSTSKKVFQLSKACVDSDHPSCVMFDKPSGIAVYLGLEAKGREDLVGHNVCACCSVGRLVITNCASMNKLDLNSLWPRDGFILVGRKSVHLKIHKMPLFHCLVYTVDSVSRRLWLSGRLQS